MEIQKGEWYFSVQCTKCDATIYFSHDPSKGKLEIAARKETVIKISCPACNWVDEYDQTKLFSRKAEYV
jgi:RNase P subunit RPR2